MSKNKIAELKKDIKDLEDVLSDKSLSKEERQDHEETLGFLEVELAEEEGKGAKAVVASEEKAEEGASEKPKGKRGRKPSAEPKEPKAKVAKEPKVAKAKKPRKEKATETESTIIVDGKEYNMDDCREAIEALYARKKQSEKSAKKYKSKKPAVKASENIETVVHHIEKAITAKAEAKPSLVIETMKKFRSELNVAFNTLAKIMTKEDITSLKKSFQAIDEIIDKYK